MARPRCTFLAVRGPAPAGFTLVEILLGLAIVALIAALALPGINALLRTIDNQDPGQILWDTIIAARERALTADHEVWLRMDREKKALVWQDGAESRVTPWPAEVSLEFLRPVEGAAVLLGGRLVETQEIPAVRFYPDGTCDRFRVQLRPGAGATRLIAVDPWTCAPLLAAEGRQ